MRSALACLRYLRYVLRHKWFVMTACFRCGLWWRGVTHDWSKLRPSEFFPYAMHFYGDPSGVRDRTGYYFAGAGGDAAFDRAWLLHQRRNAHHWEHWVMPMDRGPAVWEKGTDGSLSWSVRPLRIPDKVLLEMVCDWIGAARAKRSNSVRDWWIANGGRMLLHPDSRGLIEALLFPRTIGSRRMWKWRRLMRRDWRRP
ncbi:MAG: hypothetical protein JRN42_07720 [Nitrososphaerota archaeon]|nr:hypothetical protein [Nitrososphaerota archaeon]